MCMYNHTRVYSTVYNRYINIKSFTINMLIRVSFLGFFVPKGNSHCVMSQNNHNLMIPKIVFTVYVNVGLESLS